MTANTSLERRVAEHYASEPPLRAPDRVLHAALASIETTRQRRGLLAPWRFLNMNNYAKVAAGAVVVVALGAIALTALPNRQPPGTGSSLVPSSTGVPSPSVSPTLVPSAPPESRPPNTGTFTSATHGIELSYPASWTAQEATESWEPGAELPWNFGSPAADFIFDPSRGQGKLFLGFASQPLGDESATEWIDRMLATVDPEPCAETESVAVDGAQGRLARCNEPLRAFVTVRQRGYAIFLYRSDDEPWVPDVYGLEFFNELLESVQLRPGDAAAAPRTSG